MKIPALRFNEFSEPYSKCKIGEIIGSLESGVSVNSEDLPISNNGEFGILKTSCISGGVFNENENKKILGTEIGRARLNPSQDAILVSRMNTPQLVGEVGYITKDYPNLYVTDRLWLIQIKNKSYCLPLWFSYQLTTKSSRDKIFSIASGTSGSMKNISQTNFCNLEIQIPCLEEQQKIVSFLSAVDQKISLLTQKHDCLTAYKKGVMQKLFNQEIRFKDDTGNDYPEWEEKSLAEVTKKKASPISANKIEQNFGSYKIYGASGVIKTIDFFTEENPYVSVVKDGAGVGRAFLCEGKTSVLGTMEMVIPEASIHVKYLYEVISRINFREYVTGSTIPHVYYKDYSLEVIPLPCIDEQEKIASFLSALDDKISNVQKQIDLTKQYKQGLLQQMFI